MSSFWKCRNPSTKKQRLGRTALAAKPSASETGPDGSTLRQWISVDESATEIFDRLRKRFLPTILPMPPLHRMTLHGRHVLEIAGVSGSGKSELLLQSVVSCLLPEDWEGLSLGGSEKPVVYYDLDRRFDIRRLAHLLECRIYNAKWDAQAAGDGLTGMHTDFAGYQRLLNLTSDLIHALVKTCLGRFYLKRCHDTFEMLAVLKTTRYHFKQIGVVHGSFPELLLIDSITAFYWTERVSRSQYGEGGRQTLNLQTVAEAVVNELRQLVCLYPKLLIMATKTIILKNRRQTEHDSRRAWHKGNVARAHRPGFRPFPEELFESEGNFDSLARALAKVSTHADFLPAHWRGFVTHRILLRGPHLSELASTDKFSRLSRAFFAAEWDKPFSRDVHFFTLQIVRAIKIFHRLFPSQREGQGVIDAMDGLRMAYNKLNTGLEATLCDFLRSW